jgi:hypothetical protein
MARLTESRLQAMIKRPFEHHPGQISAKCCLKNTPDCPPIEHWHIRTLLFAMTIEGASPAASQMYVGANTSFLSSVYVVCSVAVCFCFRNLFASRNLLLASCFLGDPRLGPRFGPQHRGNPRLDRVSWNMFPAAR